MGNRLSTKGSGKQKRRNRRIKERNKLQEKTPIVERELEIAYCYDERDEENFIVSSNYKDRDKDCKKEAWHSDYIPFQDLTLQELPGALQHQALYDYIRARGNLVVLIRVREISPERACHNGGGSRYGHKASGYACVVDGHVAEMECPIPNCDYNDNLDCSSGDSDSMQTTGRHKIYGGVVVMTNQHVILNDFECENSDFYFFYNSGNSRDCKAKGQGFCVRDDSSKNEDYVGVKIFLHDASVVEQLRQFTAQAVDAWDKIPQDIKMEFKRHAVVISHPHSWPKQVSFGNLLQKEQLMEEEDDEESGGGNNNNNKNNDKQGHVAGGGGNDDNDGTDEMKKKMEKKVLKKSTSVTGRRYVTKYSNITCTGSSGSPVLTGFYWDNPFIHSSGVIITTGDERRVCGESYFY